jgi:hypothetical protein
MQTLFFKTAITLLSLLLLGPSDKLSKEKGSYKISNQTCYTYVVGKSKDFKITYISTVFSFQYNSYIDNCSKITNWADNILIDKIADFAGSVQQAAHCSHGLEVFSKESIEKERALIIWDARNRNEKIVIVEFPSSYTIK